ESSGMSSTVLWTQFPEHVLVAYGAKLNYLINAPNYQWWRFIAPMYIHINLIHLLVNMYSLMMVGPFVEKLYGSAKFTIFWVVTGIFGLVASYLTVRPQLVTNAFARFIFKSDDLPSAGASGALFGLVGVLFVFGIKFRRELPEGFKRAFGTGMLPIIFLNLFIGYVGRGFIDNAAHLGGLLSGALVALVVDYGRPGERSGIAATWQVLKIAAIALVVVSFFKTAQHLGDPLPAQFVTAAQSAPTAPSGEAENAPYLYYAKATSDAHEAFNIAMADGNTGYIDAAIVNLEKAPHLEKESDDLRGRLKLLLNRARESSAAATASPPATKPAPIQKDQLAKDFVAWRKDYNRW